MPGRVPRRSSSAPFSLAGFTSLQIYSLRFLVLVGGVQASFASPATRGNVSSTRPGVIEFPDAPPHLSDGPFLSLSRCLCLGRPCWSWERLDAMFDDGTVGTAYLMAKYSLLPSRTSSIFVVIGSSVGFAVVINPPASWRMAMPAATSLNSKVSKYLPPSDEIIIYLTTPNTLPPTKYQTPPWPYKPGPSSH